VKHWLWGTALLLFASSLSARTTMWQPEPGIYTNEEQAYFEAEAGRVPPPWVGVSIIRDAKGVYRYQPIDRFAQPIGDPDRARQWPTAGRGGKANGKRSGDIYLRHGNTDLVLRRARPATCWVAIPKDKPKPDGSPDWLFVRDVKLHDQGGRATIGGGDSGAAPLVVRLRNVIWPAPTTNKPSIVLYIHKPDQPDRAESYAWADPGVARIGINLRWMQASCGIDGAKPPSRVTTKTFRA
jgi:hypothetical protein